MIRAESRTEVDDRLGFATPMFQAHFATASSRKKGSAGSAVLESNSEMWRPGHTRHGVRLRAHGVRNPLVASLRLLAGRRRGATRWIEQKDASSIHPVVGATAAACRLKALRNALITRASPFLSRRDAALRCLRHSDGQLTEPLRVHGRISCDPPCALAVHPVQFCEPFSQQGHTKVQRRTRTACTS
jgi:hypothetical protein